CRVEGGENLDHRIGLRDILGCEGEARSTTADLPTGRRRVLNPLRAIAEKHTRKMHALDFIARWSRREIDTGANRRKRCAESYDESERARCFHRTHSANQRPFL